MPAFEFISCFIFCWEKMCTLHFYKNYSTLQKLQFLCSLWKTVQTDIAILVI